jgi:polyphosphate kinase
MIEKLYEASRAGVQIRLVVRGICTLVPGVEGLSENIRVKSIVGEFLEHSRIYIFHNDGDRKVFLSSADWMSRNLNRRIELMFPVEDPLISERINRIMSLYLKDNVKSWQLNSDGSYSKKALKEDEKRVHAQELLKSLDYLDSESFSEALVFRNKEV